MLTWVYPELSPALRGWHSLKSDFGYASLVNLPRPVEEVTLVKQLACSVLEHVFRSFRDSPRAVDSTLARLRISAKRGRSERASSN